MKNLFRSMKLGELSAGALLPCSFLLLCLSITDAAAQGQVWQIFSTQNSPLPHDIIWCLAHDSTGRTWIGTHKGMALYDHGTWQVLDQYRGGSIEDVLVTRDGKTVVGFQRALYVHEKDTVKRYPATLIDEFVETKDGHIWGMSAEGWYLSEFDFDTLIVHGSDDIYATCMDSLGNIWSGAPNPFGTPFVESFNGSIFTRYDRSTYCLATHPDGRVFLGNEDGISIFDGIQWKWNFWQVQNSGLPANKVFTLDFEKDGTLWAGTSEGLVSFDGMTWTVFSTQTSPLPDNIVDEVQTDRGGNVWIATKKGVAVYNPKGIVSMVHEAAPEDASELNVEIWPHPVSIRATIRAQGKRITSLFVYDLLGRKAGTVMQSADDSFFWLREKLPPGIYTLVLRSDSKTAVRKIAVGNSP